MSLLAISEMSKTYVAAPALRSVSLSIEPGEVHALVGENGAGKSTLIKILAGAVRPDHAEISIDGRAVAIDHPATAYALGLRFIHQELNVVPALSVAENIFIGRPYPRRLGAFVDWRRLRLAAAAALQRLGITHIDPRRQMAELATGDHMLVCLSAALLEGSGAPARLTVMDEPTAALTAAEAERLFKVLAEIRRSGGSVLYVSHRLDEVMRFCDRVTVLRDGAVIATTPVAETSQDEIVRMMIGRRIEGAYPPPLAPAGGEICLTVRNRGQGGTALEIREGEIVGLAGLSGAGQSELLRRAMGEMEGAVLVDVAGLAGPPRSLRSAWKSGLAYVPGERRSEGLVLSRAIFENVTLPHLDVFSLGGAFLTPRRERAVAAARGGEVRLKARGPRQLCLELSGGNQQKVVFARALAGSPKILLLDEPTRGVDVGARFDIYSIIRERAAKGVAVVIASSDFPELIGLCDRIAVMQGGEIADVLPASGLSEEALFRRCYAARNGAAVEA